MSKSQPKNDTSNSNPPSHHDQQTRSPRQGDVSGVKKAPTNEYVLNVAFGSFLGFTLLQFVFALVARSEAMLADCAAMTVDAVTYLFNYCAERMKHRENSEDEKTLPADVLHRRRKLQRLYLELFPPMISVATLVIVTIMALKKAINTIQEDYRDIKNPPDVIIMVFFSGLNCILDAVNVTCFARVEDQVVGLPPSSFQHEHDPEATTTTEMSGLFEKGSNEDNDVTATYAATGDEVETCDNDDDDDESESSREHLNLNMCSAWTHIFADTLRSVAVLCAAGFSALFPDILSPVDADSYSAILVSVIIILSLGPLIQGLVSTALQIRGLVKEGRDNDYSSFHAISRR